MISKAIADITEEDLQRLIDDEVGERKTIEYKATLPADLPEAKKEFLADVSSLANSSGGDIVYGMAEDPKTGLPTRLVGLAIDNVDKEILRRQALIRDGIEPRLPLVDIQPVNLLNGRVILVIRIPRSWMGPHQVTFRNHAKFYSRDSNGKHQLDVTELRTAFTLSAGLEERIKRFRADRLSNIVADETPVQLGEGARIVVHVVPFSAFELRSGIDVAGAVADTSLRELMLPLCRSTSQSRYNLDGYLTIDIGAQDRPMSYFQLFRTGVIEAVDARMLRSNRSADKTIPAPLFERNLADSLKRYLTLITKLLVSPPVVVFVSLLNVRGYSLADHVSWDHRDFVVDRDVVMLPDTVVESFEGFGADSLAPCFDALWNACGYAKSRTSGR